jgi:cell division protein FtsQ
VSEPTPAHGESNIVPDSVLDELRSAFEGGRPEGRESRHAGPTAIDGLLDPTLPSTAMLPVPDPADEGSAVRVSAGSPSKGRASRRDRDRDRGRRRNRGQAARSSTDSTGGSAWQEADEPGWMPQSGTTIVIGGHDDLADAVYLDDGADDVAIGKIVIGDELDSSGAFDAVAPPTRSMDPRVRARRIAVKRALGRKRLIWIAGVVLGVLVVVATLAVFASSLFGVERVDVTGAVYTNPDQLQKIIDDLSGQPILLVDTLAIEKQLEQIPWVERAIVTTDFPHTVGIDIRERQPLATFQGSDGRYRVIDREGRVLDVLDNRPVDYFLITGQAPDADPGEFAGAAFSHAAQLGSALPGEIRSVVVSLSADAGSGDLGMLLQPNVEVRLGGFDDLDAKLARLLQRMHDPKGLTGVVGLDVSTDNLSETRG